MNKLIAALLVPVHAVTLIAILIAITRVDVVAGMVAATGTGAVLLPLWLVGLIVLLSD